MITKPKYSINDTSKTPWVPLAGCSKTINNRSSVAHNIISHEGNDHSPNMQIGLLDKKVNNKKKGIGEFSDLQRITSVNINHEHRNAYHTDQHIFKRKNGVFTHLYDAAARFGEDKPFKA